MSESVVLLDYKLDVYSQNGEDGIIARALDILPHRDGWCVEFGAWDGRHLSNCANLITASGYHAVLIEADRLKFEVLRKNYKANRNVIAINQFVGFSPEDNLDAILTNTPIPSNFDFLSIDIDGNDYHVWNAIQRHRPKIVCIEYNPTIPNEVEFIQRASPDCRHGSSVKALVGLANEKGYELICLTICNAFFVDRAFYPKFRLTDNSVAALRKDQTNITHLFSGYDGTVFISGYGKLPWHEVPITAKKLQLLPRVLRKFPADYDRWQSLAWRKLYATGRSGTCEAPTNGAASDSMRQQSLRRLARRLSPTLYSLLRRGVRWMSERSAERRWRADGKPIPAPAHVKRALLRDYAKQRNLKVFVETGTWIGDTVDFMRRDFDVLHSIELGSVLYCEAAKRFVNEPKITIWRGDSGIILGEVVGLVDRPALFWLDGHYSGGATARGMADTPIERELHHIASSELHGQHLVVIDDARCFNGEDGYPTESELRELSKTLGFTEFKREHDWFIIS